MITLAWANIGAAVAPDVALASVAAAIILVKGGKFTAEGIGVAIAIAILLAVAGLFLTMPVRTASIAFVHAADKAAEHGNIAGVERAYYLSPSSRFAYCCASSPSSCHPGPICSTCPWLDA